jgi:uncharacterized membrane protein required for colicin V production
MMLFNFTMIDWLIVLVIVSSVIVSWFKGFFRELFGLLTVVVAVLLAAWLYRFVGGAFKDVVRTEKHCSILGLLVDIRGDAFSRFCNHLARYQIHEIRES